MKVLVISLARSSDRRPEIKKQLDDVGLPFEIVEAVEGSALSPQEMEAQCDMEAIRARPNHLSPGAIGCALSHLKAYKMVLEQDLPHALICEDDVLIPRDLPAILDGIARHIEPDEVCSLYYRGFHPITLSDRGDRLLSKEHRMLFPIDRDSIPLSTVGYVVSREVCRTLAEVISPIRYASDQWYHFIEEGGMGRLSVVYPRPLGHGDFKSAIDYVDSYGSKLQGRVSRFINDHKIPVLWSILKMRRRYIESEMSDFRLSNQPSIYASPSASASPSQPHTVAESFTEEV